MSRYVVTGAAGFIGSHLAESLIAAGHEVIAMDCFRDHYDPALKGENAAEFEVQRVDLAEAPLESLLADADGVFHLAAKPGVRSSWGSDFAEYLRDNVLATQRLFETAGKVATRVVWASSSSVYGDASRYPTPEDTDPRPVSPYGVTKLACERLAFAYARNLSLDAVTLRYFTVYGPRQRPDMAFARLIAALAEGQPFELYGDGSQSRGFTYVADAVSATILAMEKAPSGALYNVGGGSEATMKEAVELAEKVSGREVKLVTRDRMPGDVRRTAADISRIQSGLAWQPSVSLEDGLAAQWKWATAKVAAPH